MAFAPQYARVAASDIGRNDWVIVISTDTVLDSGATPWVPITGAAFRFTPVDADITFIGTLSGVNVYLALASEVRDSSLRFVSMRALLGRTDTAMGRAVSRALMMAHWRHQTRHCGACGAPATHNDSEPMALCPTCKGTRYPAIHPCVMVAVVKDDSLLLARNRGWPADFYSLVAGFCETGESLEEACAREVLEETNIAITGLRYAASQPWALPSQLMVGFFADYSGGDIKPDGVEISDAQWFTKDTLPRVPTSDFSLAGQLLDMWRAGAPLSQSTGAE